MEEALCRLLYEGWMDAEEAEDKGGGLAGWT
jgi:hypothetical protein